MALDCSLKGADTVLKAGVVCLLGVWVRYDWVVKHLVAWKDSNSLVPWTSLCTVKMMMM